MIRIQTKSIDFDRMSGWTPTVDCLENISVAFEVGSKQEMQPCGCGIKLDLQDVVYPALERLLRESSSMSPYSSARRVDAHVEAGNLRGIQRIVCKTTDLAERRQEISNSISDFAGDSVIELLSISADYFGERERTRERFAQALDATGKILDLASINLVQKNPARGLPLRFGKGHSIGAGGNFVMLDILRHETGPGYSVSNNDTIVTADSMLQHCAPVSVFTALNNALNDLFLLGVNQELIIYPVYDGTTRESAVIQDLLRTYADFYRERGAILRIEDQGPLNLGTKIIGATVIGKTNHELPSIAGLIPGQQIWITRFLGDLSLLSQHRALHFPHQPHPDLDEKRIRVLQRFMSPNFLVASVIRKYLPQIGEKMNPDRHITYASDLSGPGLYVLEEAANQSGVDIAIHDLKFIDEGSLAFYRKNHTSSTNGPIVMAAMPSVLRAIEQDLNRIGLDEVWRAGEVLEKSESPTVFLHPNLKNRYASLDPRTDLFEPEVHFGSGNEMQKIRVPIFDKFEFLE